MGYFINYLKKGSIYKLEGELLSFQKKYQNLYVFFVVKYDIFNEITPYVVTEEEVLYTAEEINFIKLVEHSRPSREKLKSIGKEKLWKQKKENL